MLRTARRLVLTALAALAFAASAGGAAADTATPPVSFLSTVRLSQLTGNYDPEGLPHLNDTSTWGMDGVDYGATVEHNGRLYILFGDVPQQHRPDAASRPPQDADAIVSTTDLNPEPNGIRLRPVLAPNNYFAPFRLRLPGPSGPVPIHLGSGEIPTGAFSYGGRLYAFIVRGNENPASSLTVAVDANTLSAGFNPVFTLSSITQIPQGGAKFFQVAPWVVRNADVPGLPSAQGDGLIMFGQGAGQSGPGVFLAWMPLVPGRLPAIADIRYYTTNGGNRWSPRQADATRLFATRFGWATLSVERIRETGLWMLVNHTGGEPRSGQPSDPSAPIVARVAATPWALAQAVETRLFDPNREQAWGRYMHRPGSADGLNRHLPPHPETFTGFAYGAFLLNRYTRWDAANQVLTVYYLMSTGTPYQVQLMRTRVRIANSVASVRFSPGSIPAGSRSTGTVTLRYPATAGTTVRLSCDYPGLLSVPMYVPFSTGATSASFTVTAARAATSRAVTVTAIYDAGRSSLPGSLVILPAPDAYEPDNTAAAAKRILPGQMQYRSIHVTTDEDWAWFQLDRDAVVDVTTGGYGNGDTELWLYAADGTSQIAYNDDNAGTRFARLTEQSLPAGRYLARVRSYHNASVLDAYSLRLGLRPAAPSDLTAEAVSATEIALSWTDQSSDEQGFQMERQMDGGAWQPVTQVGPNAVSYSDTTVAPETTYSYRVRAFNSAGPSAYTEEAAATTPAAVVYYQVSGTVYYYNQPLEGAEVRAGGQTAVTGPDGTYSFLVPAGSVTIQAYFDNPGEPVIFVPSATTLDLQADVTGVDFFGHLP